MSTKRKVNDRLIRKLEALAGEPLTLGGLLRAIRLGEELSQTRFAELLGISKQYLCDIEKGRKYISPRAAADFAYLLGYSEKQFIRFCLQDLMNRDGFHFKISLEAA